jgi:hypothetical protein
MLPVILGVLAVLALGYWFFGDRLMPNTTTRTSNPVTGSPTSGTPTNSRQDIARACTGETYGEDNQGDADAAFTRWHWLPPAQVAPPVALDALMGRSRRTLAHRRY